MPFGPIGGAGGSLNVPDDHRFSTTAQRDAAIPNPEEGEQCTIESSIPQYHLLQEYRSGQWVDITYIITGPKGDTGSKGDNGNKSVVLDASTTYATVQDLLYSQNKILTDNFGAEIYININIPIADLDNERAGTVYFYVNNVEMSIVNGYVRNVVTGSLFRLEPGSQYFFYYDKPTREFVNLLCFGGVAVYPNQLLNFTTPNWTMPDGNRTLFLPSGTITNLDDHVNNREAAAIVEIVSINDRSSSTTQACCHIVTLVSNDAVVNGTRWIRTSPTKGSITSAAFLELTGASETKFDPSEGFNLKKDKSIIIEDGAELRQIEGSYITGAFTGGTHNITQIIGNKLVLGTTQGNVELELHSGVAHISAQVGGYSRRMAFQEETVKSIQEGTGIKVDSTDVNEPIVSVDPAIIKDPSEGFELKADKTIDILSSAELVLHRGSFLSGKFSDNNTHRIIDFGEFYATKDQVRVGNHLIDIGLQLETSQRFIYALTRRDGQPEPLRYTVAVNQMILSPFTRGASIYELDDGTNYVGIDRQTPVIVTEAIDDLTLVKITDHEVITEDADGVPTVTQLPKVRKGTYGDFASGFSLCPGGVSADTQIVQIASGTYSLDQMTFALQTQAESLVYVGQDGKLTLTPSDYIAGWVINDGVVIDIDLYNSSVASNTGTGTGLQPNTDIEVSKVTVANQTDLLYKSVFNVTNGGNTELNLVGTTNLRKVDKTTGVATDVVNVNGTSGAIDLRTDVTYQGAITDDKAVITKEYLEAFGRGIGVPEAVDVSGGNTYQQTAAVALFSTVGTDINDVLIQLDAELLEAETIISMPYDLQISSKSFDIEQIAGQGTTRNIRTGDTWKVRMIVDQNGANRWFWEKVYSSNSNVVYGLAGRNDVIDEVGVKAFAYAEGMPYHLLLETPTSSRLFHEFPRNKTFRFTPISTGREHDGNVVINQSNQGVANGDLALGQYSDLPLYIIEPNFVVNRDQRAWINFPANMTIDVSGGFYVFGTVSGWCGNNNTEGNVAVYLGNSENFRSYTNNIGFVLGNTGFYLLDGQNLRTGYVNPGMGFNVESGVTHMYRYAFYVDDSGLMTYYIVNLNNGLAASGELQCTLSSIGDNAKLYISYDRYGNNTAAIAIAETHLVLNSVGNAEGRWNWRN